MVKVRAPDAIASGGTVVQRLEDGNWIALLDPKGQPTVTFDPPVGPQYPLRVGRSWSAKHRMTALATGNVTDFEVSCNVEAYEKVTCELARSMPSRSDARTASAARTPTG